MFSLRLKLRLKLSLMFRLRLEGSIPDDEKIFFEKFHAQWDPISRPVGPNRY
jgi:hypothetical protein